MSADAPRTTGRADTNRREMFLSIFGTLFFDIGLSMVIFYVARHQGASDTAAYLLSTIGPLLGMGFEFIRHRRLDNVGVVILALIIVQFLISLIGSTDPKMLLLKDSLFTGGIGLIFLVSITPLFRRPLLWHMGRKFATDGTDEGIQWWESLWQYEGFRRSQRMITGVWGAAYLIESIAKIFWIYALPFDTAYFLNQVVPLAVTIALFAWTFWYAARTKRAGEARRAAALAEKSAGQQ